MRHIGAIVSAAAAVAVALSVSPAARGQVVHDGTTGPAGPLPGPSYAIGPERGSLVGSNLFHSFSRFDIRSGEIATFSGPGAISNVLARVTSGVPSTIDGTIRCTIPEANLYLINPAGIVFGSGARLDLGGSFAATTADVVHLADGGRFDARTPANDVLTSAPPAAFGFLGAAAPASISVRGDLAPSARTRLSVSDGRKISLVGGNISVSAADVSAPGGKLDVISVASAGEVRGIEANSHENPALAGFDRLGDVTVSETAQLLASGDRGGSIYVRAARLDASLFASISSQTESQDGAAFAVDVELDDELALRGASSIGATATGVGASGAVRVRAPLVRLESDVEEFGSFVSTLVFPGASGRGGDVHVIAERVEVRGDGAIAAATAGSGAGGNVLIAADEVLLQGALEPAPMLAAIRTSSAFDGRGGNVTLDVRRLVILESAGVFARSLGLEPGGLITIDADEVLLSGTLSTISADGNGVDGGIRLRAGSLTVDNNAIISTDTFFDRPGGEVTIDVDHLRIGGDAAIQSLTATAGDGGIINLDAQTIEMDGPGGGVAASSLGGGRSGTVRIRTGTLRMTGTTEIRTATFEGGGTGGAIEIRADAIELLDSAGISASSLVSADAGTIDLQADRVVFRGPGVTINSSTVSDPPGGASGRGGVIRVRARDMLVADGAVIAASTNTTGAGGSIELEVSETLTIRGDGGADADPDGVFSRSRSPDDDAGPGGNISLRANRLSLESGATVSAESTGAANAGNVDVQADHISLRGGSSVASSGGELASGGTISLQAARALDLSDSRITAQAARDGGNISIIAVQRIYLLDSAITAEAGNDGGNITIDPVAVVLNRSRIIANAVFGNGGDITIAAQAFLPSRDSQVSASSQFGLSGAIEITAPDRDIAGELVELPRELADAATRLQEFCGQRIEDFSSFLMINRGGIPLAPGEQIPSLPVTISAPPPPATQPTASGR